MHDVCEFVASTNVIQYIITAASVGVRVLCIQTSAEKD